MKNRVKILGVAIDPLTKEEAVNRLSNFLLMSKPSIITTPNTEFIIKAQTDSEFRDLLNKSDLNICDSFGLLWAARFQTKRYPKNFFKYPLCFIYWLISIVMIPIFPKYYKQPIPERISGSDFIWDISRFAAENKLRIFLLGGAPTVAERTALKLQTEINDLRVCGVHSGDISETDQMIEAINKAKADIVLVCFGAPKQEVWLHQNLKKTSAKFGAGLGGSFDFIAGVKKRAPKWMQRSGLEWLYRLILEPKRVIRMLAIPKLMMLMFISKFNEL